MEWRHPSIRKIFAHAPGAEVAQDCEFDEYNEKRLFEELKGKKNCHQGHTRIRTTAAGNFKPLEIKIRSPNH